MMKTLLSTTALAGLFALGTLGMAQAQAVNPSAPGSASGGVLAQSSPSTSGSSSTAPTQNSDRSTTQLGTGQPGSGGGSATGSQGMTSGQAGREQGRTGVTGQTGVGGTQGTAQGTAQTQPGATSGSGGPAGSQAQRMSESQVRDMLRQRGYSDISELRSEGDAWRAKARQGGREVNVRIDRDGTVRPQN